jgi:hypothetical protein
MKKPLRCRIGWHRWNKRYSSDGTSAYLQCQRCPKISDFDFDQWHPPAVM